MQFPPLSMRADCVAIRIDTSASRLYEFLPEQTCENEFTCDFSKSRSYVERSGCWLYRPREFPESHTAPVTQIRNPPTFSLSSSAFPHYQRNQICTAISALQNDPRDPLKSRLSVSIQIHSLRKEKKSERPQLALSWLSIEKPNQKFHTTFKLITTLQDWISNS